MASNHDMDRKKAWTATLPVVSNVSLVLFKLVVGTLIGSVSIISEAIHSGVDLVAALISLFAVRESAKPADEEHPYGHGKFENVSGTLQAILLFLAAIGIIVEAVGKLLHPVPVEAVGFGVAVMAFSALINWIVSTVTFRVARLTESVAMEATAWDLRTDVYTSAGVGVALMAIWGGNLLWPSIRIAWIDPVAGIAVALLIIRAAWYLSVKSTKDLLDGALPPEEEEWIKKQMRSISPLICGVHRLRTRKSGAQRFIDLHLVLDPSLSLFQANRLSDMAVAAIQARFKNASVTIHQEPCRTPPPHDKNKCKDHCKPGCLLP